MYVIANIMYYYSLDDSEIMLDNSPLNFIIIQISLQYDSILENISCG